MSRLLLRIERELSSESNANKRAELIAQRASYHARIGRFSEAKAAVADLRSQFGDGHSGPITVRIMIAEAIIRLFENLHPDALDRLLRAQFLSKLMKEKALVALASAWKAHVEFEVSNFSGMFESLELVRDNADKSNHAARARYAMVLCDLAYLCGETDRGQAWFMRSRDHALEDGDQAGIEALLYNKAAFRLAWFRAQRCFGEIETDELDRLRIELASARNFQELVGISALIEFSALCEARLSVLQHHFVKAIEQLEAVRTRGPFASYNFSQPFVDLEITYCLARLNRIDEAVRKYETAKNLSVSNFDIDEQLVALWMQSELSAMDSRFGDALAIRVRFELSVKNYHDQISLLKSGTTRFEP